MRSQAAHQIVLTVGRNIARARDEAGLTQHELGVKMDTHAGGISRWETGRVMPSPQKLSELSDALGKDPGWFYIEHEAAAA